MDAPDLGINEAFLDALEAVVLAALERIGDDTEAPFRRFLQLQAVAMESVVSAADYRRWIRSAHTQSLKYPCVRGLIRLDRIRGFYSSLSP